MVRTPKLSVAACLVFAVVVGCDAGNEAPAGAAAPAAPDHTAALDKLDKRLNALEVRLGKLELAAPPQDRSEEINALATRMDTLTKNLESVQSALDAGAVTPAKEVEVEYEVVGVPECDDYLRMYTKCIEEKVPEAARTASLEALKLSADAWRSAAATEAGREGLRVACEAANDAVQSICGS